MTTASPPARDRAHALSIADDPIAATKRVNPASIWAVDIALPSINPTRRGHCDSSRSLRGDGIGIVIVGPDVIANKPGSTLARTLE